MPVDTERGQVRLRVANGVPLVRIRNPSGRLEDFYGSRILPEWADWDTEQVLHFLEHGLVEACDDAGNVVDPGRVWECLSALISCGVPEDAGRPRAADILRAEGLRYSNECIGKAIALRKSGTKFGEA